MSRRKSADTQPSLFPFLAVLVSTMGALIFLLLVISRQVQLQRNREHAQAQVLAQEERDKQALELAKRERQKPPPVELEPLPPLPAFPELPPLPELQEYPEIEPLPPFELKPVPENAPLPEVPPLRDDRQQLTQRHKELQAQLAALVSRLSEAVDPTDRVSKFEKQAKAIQIRLAELDKTKQQRQTALREMEEHIDRLSAKLSRRRRKSDQPGNKYAIVPYFGASGTARRPIYLECIEERLVLQPEGVAVTERQLQGMEHAVQVIGVFVEALTRQLQTDSSEGKPYPLLIVRPDGIGTFYAARKALEQFGVEYGYELVDAGVELDYPAEDPIARSTAIASLKDSTGYAMVWSDEYGWQMNGQAPAPTSGQTGVGEADQLRTRFSHLFEGGGAMPPSSVGNSSPEPGATEFVGGTQSSDGSRPFQPGGGDISGTVENRPPAMQLPSDINLSESQGHGAAVPIGNPGGGVEEQAAEPPKLLASASQIAGGRPADLMEMNLGTKSNDSGESPFRGLSGGERDPAGANRSGTQSTNQLSDNNPIQPIDPNQQQVVDRAATNAGAIRFLARPVRRTIDIGLQSSQLVLYPEGTMLTINSDTDVTQLARKVLLHATELSRTWGDAGPRNRWSPVVKFHVFPDGLENYYKLRMELLPSGMEVDRELLDWSDAPTFH